MNVLKSFKPLRVWAGLAVAFMTGCGGEEAPWKPASVNPVPETSVFTDSRDKKVYKTVRVGAQIWMSQNLDYDAPNITTDVCYNNSPDSCAKYGRLYDWNTAKTVCPAGWHLPTDAEWTALTDNAGGSSAVGTKLKSASGWNHNGSGTNDYGFSALPGGLANSGGGFYDIGDNSYLWSATESAAGLAWNRSIDCIYEYVGRYKYDKSTRFSVRCVQDWLFR